MDNPAMQQPRARRLTVLTLFGAAFLLMALIMIFVPVSSDITDYNTDTSSYEFKGTIGCGNVLFGKSEKDTTPSEGSANCYTSRDLRWNWITPFLIGGLILLPLGLSGLGSPASIKWEVRRVQPQ
jgi:hypothetical protein